MRDNFYNPLSRPGFASEGFFNKGVGPASPAPWTPIDSGVLAAWYDPSDDAYLIFNPSDPTEIIGAVDRSGNGHHMGIQGVGQLIRGDINGVQAIDHWEESGRAIVTPRFNQLAVIFTQAADPTDTRYSVFGDGTSYELLAMEGHTSTGTYRAGTISRGDVFTNGIESVVDTIGDIWSALQGPVVCYSESEFLSGWVNFSHYGYRGSSNWYTGKEGEFIYLTARLAAPERMKFEGYLAHKWGTAWRLPFDHPYKLSPPMKGGTP